MMRIRTLATLLSVVSLAACEKNAVQSITQPATGAFIRFQNYAVSAPGVNFYANDQKLTAINSTSCTPPTPAACTTTGIESTTGVAYGATANGINYSMLTPGQYKLTGRIAAATDNGLPIASLDANLADGKFYSFFTSGIYNSTTKTSESFIIEDALPTTFDYSKAYIRFVNASSNATAITAAAKLQGTTTVVPITATGVGYKSASPIVTLVPGLTDVTLTANGVSVTFTGFNLLPGHVLTLALRGDATSSSTTTGLILTGVYNR